MQARTALKLAPAPKNTCEPHHHGAIRIEEQPGGRRSIVAVRIVNRAIQKKRLDLTAEEFAALDEIFGRTETPVQLVLDLPGTRSGPAIPMPKGPSRARPKRYFFRRRGGNRG